MMDEYHLSPGQPKVLRYLNAHQDCKLKDIADECDIESATVSKMIDNLEKKGKCCECFLRTAKVIYCLQGKRKNHGLYKPAFE